jgi:hypothetical protein
MLDSKESLTHEEIRIRFKKLFNRDMTSAEKYGFFLPSEMVTKPGAQEKLRNLNVSK